jgi:hypothetical protein
MAASRTGDDGFFDHAAVPVSERRRTFHRAATCSAGHPRIRSDDYCADFFHMWPGGHRSADGFARREDRKSRDGTKARCPWRAQKSGAGINVVRCFDDLTDSRPAGYRRDRWFPRSGIKREHDTSLRARWRGCPRNCQRRAERKGPLGNREGGARRRPASQETCHRPWSCADAPGGVNR